MKKSNAIVKVDSVENWEKAKNYIPDNFTIIIYEFKDSSPKVKIGDGIHTVKELPFLSRSEVEEDTLML